MHDSSDDRRHAAVRRSRPCWEAAEDHPVPGDDVARLRASVPEWFGQSESNAEYIDAARTKETWTVRVVDGSG